MTITRGGYTWNESWEQLQQRAERAEARIETLEAALRWYAHSDHWLEEDCGRIARAFLDSPETP